MQPHRRAATAAAPTLLLSNRVRTLLPNAARRCSVDTRQRSALLDADAVTLERRAQLLGPEAGRYVPPVATGIGSHQPPHKRHR